MPLSVGNFSITTGRSLRETARLPPCLQNVTDHKTNSNILPHCAHNLTKGNKSGKNTSGMNPEILPVKNGKSPPKASSCWNTWCRNRGYQQWAKLEYKACVPNNNMFGCDQVKM